MNKPVAYFKFIDVFTVTGRGAALAGHIIDGDISFGDCIELNVQRIVIKLNVLSVEGISSSNVGLMVGDLGAEVLEAVRLFEGQIVVVVRKI